MQKDSLARSEYTEKKGERYEAKRPTDSNILQGDGSFNTKTQTDLDFIPKKGERFKTIKPEDSDVWKASFIRLIIAFRKCMKQESHMILSY